MNLNRTRKISRLAVVAISVFALSTVFADEKTKLETDPKPAKTKAKTVRIEFDYSDGVQKILTAVPWKPKMTLGDAMEYATSHRRGVKIKIRGKGSISFLEKIDDLKNQGAKGPNWVFRVNGKLGDRSFAITPIKPGDTILWKFGTYP